MLRQFLLAWLFDQPPANDLLPHKGTIGAVVTQAAYPMVKGDVLESFVHEVTDSLDYSNDGAITCLGCVTSTGFTNGVDIA